MALMLCRESKDDDWVEIDDLSLGPDIAAELFVEEYLGRDHVKVYVKNHGRYLVRERVEYSYWAKRIR